MDYLFKCWTTVLTTPQHGHSGSCRDGLSFHLCPHMVIFCLIEEEDLKTLNWRSLSSYSASLCRSAHFSSGTQSYLTLCKPMDYSTPGFPVRHQLLELAQPHVHWIGDAIQPSHPLSSPSPSALNLSHHQGHFQWVLFLTSGGQSIGASASASDLQISCNPRDSQESFPTPQFKSINSSALSFLYVPNLTSIHDYWKNHSFDWTDLCQQSNISVF